MKALFVFPVRVCISVQILCLLIISPLFASKGIVSHLQFKEYSTLNGLPNNDVQTLFQDSNGFVWIGTKYGLFRYDGYGIQEIKSNLHNPSLLTSNNIQCITEDKLNRLWIGTDNGFNVFNKKTRAIEKIIIPKAKSNNIACILILDNDNALIGTENGLYRYQYSRQTFIELTAKNTAGVFNPTTVKSLLKDSRGDIWIGTWASGLYRLNPTTQKMYHYPPLNQQNSAHYIFEDSRGTIWVAGWSNGLHRLHLAANRSLTGFDTFTHDAHNPNSLADNLVYAISEDPLTKTLWVGGSVGLSITDAANPGKFINYQVHASPHELPAAEIDAVLYDANNNKMWLGSLGGGVIHTNTSKPFFQNNMTISSSRRVFATSIYSLYVDQDDCWIGVENHGVMRYSHDTDQYEEYNQIKEFGQIKSMSTVFDILKDRRSHTIYFASYSDGLYVYQKGKNVKNYRYTNCHFLPVNHLTALHQDNKGNIWIATKGGLGVMAPDGYRTSVALFAIGTNKVADPDIRDVITDHQNNLWMATSTQGIIRVEANPHALQQAKTHIYNPARGTLSAKHVLCLFIDSKNQLWAGTEGSGLCLYDPSSDTFVDKHLAYNLPGDMVSSIEEDESGNLWLGTNSGLVRVSSPGDDTATRIRIFTTGDGLQDNYFIPNSSCHFQHKLYFGSTKGFISFVPEELKNVSQNVNLQLTEIYIRGRKLSQLPADKRRKISAYSSEFTESITVPFEYNDVRIEFASLTYNNPLLNKYAYKLENMDDDWKYTDGTHRLAEYNNLPSGNYRFLIKATNENGDWSDVRQLNIKVLSPWWATWWAYTLYTFLLTLFAYYVWQDVKRRITLKNSLRIHVMEAYNKNEKERQMIVEVDSIRVPGSDEVFLEQAIDCVKKHMTDSAFGVSEFVEAMSTSKTTLYTRLKELTGMNLSGFIQSIRLKAACQIMQEQPGIRISDLAYAVGFNDPKYFSRCFKNNYGMQPKEYLKRYQPKTDREVL